MSDLEVLVTQELEKFQAHTSSPNASAWEQLRNFIGHLSVTCNRMAREAPASDPKAVQQAARRGYYGE